MARNKKVTNTQLELDWDGPVIQEKAEGPSKFKWSIFQHNEALKRQEEQEINAMVEAIVIRGVKPENLLGYGWLKAQIDDAILKMSGRCLKN